MKFLLYQLLICVWAVISLLYLSSLGYFAPYTADGLLNWYNISFVALLLFFLVQAFISLSHYMIKKFIAFGPKEFPSATPSLFWGLSIAFLVVSMLFLNVFHLLSLGWGVLIVGILLLLLIVTKSF